MQCSEIRMVTWLGRKSWKASNVRSLEPFASGLQRLSPLHTKRFITSLSGRIISPASCLNDFSNVVRQRRLISSVPRRQDGTIFALSTAPGKAAIAVIRCSGSHCREIYHALCPRKAIPRPRVAALRKIFSPQDAGLLDPGALVLYFPAPTTVTGEDVLELHLHGGNATVRAVLSAISSVSTDSCVIRYAEPGEFTRRAFYNRRLDLTQIEALGDNLAAETENQRRLAVRGSNTTLAVRYQSWRQQLLHARGELEALIDFSEDQHFDESPAQLAQSVAKKIKVLIKQIDASLRNASRGELLRDGIKVALLGAPNVGKSSLLNRIVGREAAIVSSEAGTTRDVVETNLDIGGFFCNFGDLAGLRDHKSPSASDANESSGGKVGEIEQEGIRRAKARALEADVVIAVRACERDAAGKLYVPTSEAVTETLAKCNYQRQRIIHVINKVDLAASEPLGARTRLQVEGLIGSQDAIFVSCKHQDGENVDHERGIDTLLEHLSSTFTAMTEAEGIPGIRPTGTGTEVSLGTSERQARLLEQCRNELRLFLDAVDLPEEALGDDGDMDIVIAAESLRAAADYLARITGEGHGDVEDVLGVVFENFCVGK